MLSMNQDKLEVEKQEKSRMIANLLGISELKCTGVGAFNSDDHYIYCYGQKSLRRNGVALIVNKTVRNTVLGCNLKKRNDLGSFPRQTIQHHSIPSLFPSH